MNKLILPNNQYIEVLNSPIDSSVIVNLVDKVTANTTTIGYWDKTERRWGPKWSDNKIFKLCKEYPQLGRLILKAQNYKEVIPVTLQWKCFKRKFKLTIHNILK